MNTFQHFDSCPLQNSNCGRGGIFYHFMAANTLATQIFCAAAKWTGFYYFYNLLSWDKSGAVRVKYEAVGEANCWIMLALEGQGCSYSALGCEHQEHTKRERESNNKIEPIKYSQPTAKGSAEEHISLACQKLKFWEYFHLHTSFQLTCGSMSRFHIFLWE